MSDETERRPSWTLLNAWRTQAEAAEARVARLEEALREIAEDRNFDGGDLTNVAWVARRALGEE